MSFCLQYVVIFPFYDPPDENHELEMVIVSAGRGVIAVSIGGGEGNTKNCIAGESVKRHIRGLRAAKGAKKICGEEKQIGFDRFRKGANMKIPYWRKGPLFLPKRFRFFFQKN